MASLVGMLHIDDNKYEWKMLFPITYFVTDGAVSNLVAIKCFNGNGCTSMRNILARRDRCA